MSIFSSGRSSGVGAKIEASSFYVLVFLIFILPFALNVATAVPTAYTKHAVASIAVLAALALFSVSKMYLQELVLPRAGALLAAWLIPSAYVLSLLFSTGGARSLFGEQLNIDSAGFVLVGTIALTLVALLINSHKRALVVHLALLSSAFVVSLIQLALFFARDAVTSIVPLSTYSVLGSLNDLAVFYGLIVAFVLTALIVLPVTTSVRLFLWVVLGMCSLFLSIVNLTVIWWIIGVYALGCLVYTLSAPYLGSASSSTPRVSIASLAVLALAGLFLFGPVSITSIPAGWANVGELDVRPSWRTTIDIGSATLKDHLIFGIGPGEFSKQWSKFMPSEINSTAFWQTDFQYGIGYIPTSVISTGILGAVAWVLLLGSLLWMGIRGLVIKTREQKNAAAQFFRVTSYIGAAYLWIIACIQVPSPALMVYAMLFTGLFIATQSLDGSLKQISVRFQENPRIGFIISLVLTVAVIASLGGVYTVGARYAAEVSYQRAVLAINERSELDVAERYLTQANAYQTLDMYYRILSNIDLARMQQLVSQNKPPQELVQPLQDLMSRAIGNAVKATEVDKDDYQNWLNLGSLYQSIVPLGIEGSLDSAQAAFDRVLELRPNTPMAYYALAGIERQRGDAAAARPLVEQAISMRNQYTDAIFLLAQLQLEQNDVTSAIKSVEAVTIFEPSNPVAFFQLGLLQYGSGSFVEAVRSLTRATTINPVYANARYFLGLSYWRLNDVPSALREFREVLKTNKDNVEVQNIIRNLEQGKQPFEVSTPSSDINGLGALPLTESAGAPTASSTKLTPALSQ
jgi:tetratricopeptide (TPR) repeat protein